MLLFYNGVIHTMDPAQPTAELILVNDRGRIVLVGDINNLATMPPFKRIDLDGRTLIPGFNDAHVHIWKLGLLLTVQIDARGLPDIPTIAERFRERAAKTSPGTWLTGRGYNEANLAEGRHLTRADLDAASTRTPDCADAHLRSHDCCQQPRARTGGHYCQYAQSSRRRDRPRCQRRTNRTASGDCDGFAHDSGAGRRNRWRTLSVRRIIINCGSASPARPIRC